MDSLSKFKVGLVIHLYPSTYVYSDIEQRDSNTEAWA